MLRELAIFLTGAAFNIIVVALNPKMLVVGHDRGSGELFHITHYPHPERHLVARTGPTFNTQHLIDANKRHVIVTSFLAGLAAQLLDYGLWVPVLIWLVGVHFFPDEFDERGLPHILECSDQTNRASYYLFRSELD